MSWVSIAKKKTDSISQNKIEKQEQVNLEITYIKEKYDSDINDIIWEMICDIKGIPGFLTTNRNHYALFRNIYERHIDMDRHINDETHDETNDETYEDFVSWNKNRFAYN